MFFSFTCFQHLVFAEINILLFDTTLTKSMNLYSFHILNKYHKILLMIKIYGSILCYTFSFKIKTLVLNISLIFLLLGKEHVFNPLNFLNYMFIGHDSSLSIHIHYPVSIHNILWLRFSVRHKVKPFKDWYEMQRILISIILLHFLSPSLLQFTFIYISTFSTC